MLAVWEAGQRRSSTEQALLLIRAGTPGLSDRDAAALPIGERDRRLLDLREDSFGPAIDAMTACPACATPLDFEFTVSQLRAPVGRDLPREVEAGGWRIRFRLPDSTDLRELSRAGGVSAARDHLLNRCLIDARDGGGSQPEVAVPSDIMERVSSRMGQCDPMGELLLRLLCPACEHAWTELFDISAFFWLEVSAVARRLLDEVNTLARAYGWREAEVLGMTPVRRQAYLALVAG